MNRRLKIILLTIIIVISLFSLRDKEIVLTVPDTRPLVAEAYNSPLDASQGTLPAGTILGPAASPQTNPITIIRGNYNAGPGSSGQADYYSTPTAASPPDRYGLTSYGTSPSSVPSVGVLGNAPAASGQNSNQNQPIVYYGLGGGVVYPATPTDTSGDSTGGNTTGGGTANRSPAINSFSPTSTTPTVNAGSSLTFSVQASDPDNNTLSYVWKLDNITQSGTTSSWIYSPDASGVGTHTVMAAVSDGSLAVNQSWTVTVNAPTPQSPVFITGLLPYSGAQGTDVIIQGAGFSANSSNNSVRFGATQSGSVTAVSRNQLHATVPQGLSPGFTDLTVRVDGSDSAPSKFDVLKNTAANVFIDRTQNILPSGSNIQDSPIARPADIDGDGDPDLFIINKTGNQAILFINDGSGNFTDGSSTALPVLGNLADVTDVKFSDVNGDRRVDMLITYSLGQSVRLFSNNGSGIFSDSTSLNVPVLSVSAVSLDTGDVNGDGDLDVIIARDDSKDVLLVNDGTGKFTADAQFNLPGVVDGSSHILFCDIDGDGDLDILTTNNNIVQASSLRSRVYVNDGAGRFTDGTTASLPDSNEYSEVLDVGDMDRDGRIDIIIANYQQNAVLINMGSGIFADQTNPRIPTNGFASKDTKLGDMDGDGDLDIILLGESRISLLMNNGSGAFTENSIKLPDYKSTPGLIGGKDVRLADIDGDGALDIIVGGGPLRILANRGENKPPVLDPIGNKTIEVGHNLTFNVNASDPNADPLLYLVEGLPAGATFQSQLFNWTPTLSDLGLPRTVRFIARENRTNGLEDSEDVLITISSGDLPVIDYYTPPELDLRMDAGAIVQFGVNAHNPRQGLGPLTFTWFFNGEEIPSITDATSAIIFIIPRIGNNTIKVRVSNSAGTISITWQLAVGGAANLPPRIRYYSPTQSDITIDLSTGGFVNFGITATDPENDPLVYTWKFDANNIATGQDLNSSAYAALATVGDHTVQAAVSDGRNPPVTHTWTLHITQSNLPPAITTYTPANSVINIDLSTGGFVNFGITATDPENDPLVYTWKFDANNIATGQDLNSSAYAALATVGDHTVKAAVSDGRNPPVTHTWTLHITQSGPINNPPTIDSHSPVNQNLNLRIGDSQIFSITASDPDAGDTLIYSWTVNGTAVGTNSNSYTYTVSQLGQFAIRATVTDGRVTTPPYFEWTVTVQNTLLEDMIKRSFNYFWNEAGSSTGLVRDRLMFNAADPTVDPRYNMASIAATGFGFASMAVAAEKYGDGSNPDWQITPAQLRQRTELIIDRLLAIQGMQNPSDDNSLAVWGKDGFFYHFVNINDGSRWDGTEVSTIDTAILVAGALTAGDYFGGVVKDKALQLYRNVNWKAFLDQNATVPNKHIAANPYYNQMYHAWSPDRPQGARFFGHWDYTSEGTLLYILAIASPESNRAIPQDTFYSFRRELGSYGPNGKPMVQSWFGSLFVYQYPQAFFKFKNATGQALVDRQGVDWWENSVEAAKANKRFCNDNINNYANQADLWGLTSAYSSGSTYSVFGAPPAGVAIPSADVRGADGTVVPSGPGGSLSMLPTEALAALSKMKSLYDTYNHQIWGAYGFTDSFKMGQTINAEPFPISQFYCGIDIGIMLIMAENYNSGLIWNKFSELEIEPGVTMRERTIQRVGLSTDRTCRISADDISATSTFHMGLVDPANPTYNIEFNLAAAATRPYLLAIHSFMDSSAGDHSVTATVTVNGSAPFNVIFNYSTSGKTPDLIKYIDISNLRIGENTITLRWQSGTNGARWLAWKNIEISSPSAHDTWAVGRNDAVNPPAVPGSEYRVDQTYYVGADVSSLAQGINKDVRNFTDILFYTENTRYASLMLDALETQQDLTNNVQVFVNGSNTAVFDATLATGQLATTPGFYLNNGWNRITLYHPGVGGGANSEWIRWESMQLIESTPPVLPAPNNFAVASFGKTRAKLRWNAVAGATKYNIYRSTSQAVPYSLVDTVTAPSASYFDDNGGAGLQDATAYFYVVKAAKSDNTESQASQEVKIKTGPYQLDYGDGHDPNTFGGDTLDNSGVRLGDNAYTRMGRYDGTLGVVRKTIINQREKNTLVLNNSNINDAVILSFKVRSVSGGEQFQINLKDGSGNQAGVSLTSSLAGAWQEMILHIADTFRGVNLSNIQTIEIISEDTGRPITLYFDAIEFDTVQMSSRVNIKIRYGSNDSQATALDFGNATVDNSRLLANQYLEINYVAQGPWGIQIYTNNRNADAHPRFTGSDPKANGLVGETNSDYRVPVIWQVWQGKRGYYNGTETPEFDTTVDDGDRAEFAFVMDKSDPDWGAPFAINYRTLFNYNGELGAPVPLAPGGGYWPRVGTVGQPLYIYLAADFRGAPAQRYSTNKLTLVIYQE